MKLKYHIILFCFCIFKVIDAQTQSGLLQNFSNPALFNLNDNECINISGEWLGEETEWIGKTSEIKGKYQIKFLLKQQGNKVTGQSFISFDNGRSNGTFNIRGMILANKLYFEEYAINEQNFTQPNVAWCLRTGELNIVKSDLTIKLEGGNYKGYATDYFFECQAKVAISLTNTAFEKPKQNNSEQNSSNLNHNEQMQLYPNPADKEVNIVFNLNKDEQVRFDLYTLSGEFISNIVNENFSNGQHQVKFNTAELIAGVYLVRMHTANYNQAAMLIISR